MNHSTRSAVSLSVSLALMFSPLAMVPAEAQTTNTSNRPQIVIAIGNSQSMDGDLSGAIMTGSGRLSSGLTSLYNSSSPVNYSVPAGFTPPLTPTQTASAPYTVSQDGTLYDNGASRLNVAKAGIATTLSKYLPSMDFALEDYSTSGTTLYSTWVYYMLTQGAKSFTSSKTSSDSYVNNPCNGYDKATQYVNSYCADIANINGYGQNTVSGSKYINILASSDDSDINDVLYSTYGSKVGVAFNYYGPYAAYKYYNNLGPITSKKTPYNYFTLQDYKAGNVVAVGYTGYTNSIGYLTGPTNAGYVPYSAQVLYSMRGFGYGATVDAGNGNRVVPMTNLGANPSVSQISAATAPFTVALQPETNNKYSDEIKALAGQSPLAGLLTGAYNTLTKLTPSCAGQYVILVTDGLPTMDSSGLNWPPLGSAAGYGYGVNAAFYGIAGNAAYGINDDSSNLPSGQTKGALDTSNTHDKALIDTITAIQKLNSGPHPIKTYVVGLGAGVDSKSNPAAAAALNAMAIAGGTAHQYPANNVQNFNAALGSIAAQIFSTIAVSAPVAPTRLQEGSLIYTATSNNNSGAIAGHIQAYQTVAAPTSGASAPMGTASGPALWDVGDPQYGLMTAANRQANLYSTVSANAGVRSIATLAQMGASSGAYSDQSAFSLSSPSPAVPNIQTILYYTWDPSYNTAGDTTTPAYPAGPSGYSYLAGRQLNWMLGSLSPNDHVQYLGPPTNANLLGIGGYVNFARNESARQKLLLFTSNDGFLYAVDSLTGKLAWGWMPREFVGQLQNYATLQSLQLFDGHFTTTDAVDTTTSPAASNWATYVVGTAYGGAYHYAIKLTDNPATSPPSPTPTKQIWGISTPNGTSPQLQTPIIVTVNGAQYAVFVVNTTTGSGSTAVTTSTLYEVNVATGQPASGSTLLSKLTLGTGVYVNSALNYVTATGTLWFGDNKGQVWNMNVTGTATADAAALQVVASTNPAAPINYVGYTELGGMPYFWAATQSEITVFAPSSGNAPIVWASSNTGGYATSSSGTLQTSTGVMALQPGGQISDAPVFTNGVLAVPVYQPPTGTNVCGVGEGYLDFFDLASGLLPKATITYKGNTVANGVIDLGKGKPLSPSTSTSKDGSVIYPSTNLPPDPGSPPTPITINTQSMNKPILWRQY